MASSFKSEGKKYSSTLTNLDSLTKTEQFPFVVKVSKSDEITAKFGVAAGTEILIQSLLYTECAKVSVLPGPDNREVNGEDLRSNRIEDEVYLIPTKYNGKVQFLLTSGDRRRYTTIAQVMENLPRYVRVEENTIVNPGNSSASNYIIPTNIVLRLVRKFVVENRVCLELTDEKNTYVFNAEEKVNFTAVQDTKSYRLFELSRMTLLPRRVQFNQCPDNDIPLLDYELNRKMSHVISGPLHLLGFVDIKLLIGWVRDKPRRTYETIVIPSDILNGFVVQRRLLHDKMKYITRKYGECENAEFVEKTLFVIPFKYRKVLWLGSPKLFCHSRTASFQLEPFQLTFEDSSENDSDDTDENAEDPHYDNIKGGLHRRRKLSKPSLLAKVHGEIKNLFRPSRQQSKKKSATPPEEEIHKKQRGMSKQRQSKRKDLARSKSFTVNTNSKRVGVYYEDNVNVAPSATFKTSQHLGYIRRGSCDNALEPIVHEYPSRRDVLDRATLPVTTTGTPKQHNANETGAPQSDHTGELTSYNGDLIDITGLKINGQTNTEIGEVKSNLPDYITMDVDLNSVMKEGCTDIDFYQYTAIQTASCFRLCALCKLADLCYINRLDGYFFKHFDLNTLRKEPYNLNSVQILKVEKIIHNGWRPLNK